MLRIRTPAPDRYANAMCKALQKCGQRPLIALGFGHPWLIAAGMMGSVSELLKKVQSLTPPEEAKAYHESVVEGIAATKAQMAQVLLRLGEEASKAAPLDESDRAGLYAAFETGTLQPFLQSILDITDYFGNVTLLPDDHAEAMGRAHIKLMQRWQARAERRWQAYVNELGARLVRQ